MKLLIIIKMLKQRRGIYEMSLERDILDILNQSLNHE